MTRSTAGPSGRYGSEARAILALAFPLALSNIAPFGFLVVNLGLLGRLDPTALASGALAYGLFMLCLSLLTGLDAAAMAIIAGARGRRLRTLSEVRATMHQGAFCSLVACLLLWCGLWWSERVFLVLGQEARIAAGAGEMTRWLMGALLPYSLFKLMRAFLGVQGRQGWSLATVLGGVALNGLLGWFFINGPPQMGVRGAGLATLLAAGTMASALGLVLARDRRLRRFALFTGWTRPNRRRIQELLTLSVPISVTLLLENGVFYAAMLCAGLYGEAQLAAHSITMQLVSLAFKIPVGLGQAASIRVAHARGARDEAASRRAGRTTLILTVCIASLVAALMLGAPVWLIGFFVDPADPAVSLIVANARGFLFFAGIFQIADAVQGAMAGVLRGYRDATVPMLLAALGYWVLGLPTGLILAGPFGMEGRGIWGGLAVGLIVVAVSLVVRWQRLAFAPSRI